MSERNQNVFSGLVAAVVCVLILLLTGSVVFGDELTVLETEVDLLETNTVHSPRSSLLS